MKLETEQEKEAFKFVCELADKATDRGCNDLPKEWQDKFKDLIVETYDDGKIVPRKATMDFDIIYWLKRQVK